MSLVTSAGNGALFVLAVVGVSALALVVYERSLGARRRHDNEFAGLLFGAGSLIYSLLIAFVIVAVWEDYEELNQTISTEAGKINDIAMHAGALPPPTARALRAALTDYCRQELRDWNQPVATRSFRSRPVYDLRIIALNAAPANGLQQKVVDLVNQDLDDVSQLRHERMDHFRSHIPGLVWLLVGISSVSVILFSFLLSTPSFKLKQIGVAFLVALIAMSVYLVYVLDHPLTGSFPVSKEPFELVLAQLRQG